MAKDDALRDYIIDDEDGYNWVSLTKPLSKYTQAELAEHLINNKKDSGSNQRIRLGGKRGEILKTDGCNTAQEFIEKYSGVLNAAGFEKGELTRDDIIEVDEKDLVPKVNTKALSKASISDYSQEELAHLIMDDRTDKENVVKYRDYTFSSEGLETVQDFINKYQNEFYKLRIKPANNEPIKNVEKETETLDTEKLQEKINEFTEVLKAVGNTGPEIINSGNLLPALADLISKKMKENRDIIATYKGQTISTEGCSEDLNDILNKYKNIIEAEERERFKKVVSDPEVKDAMEIFGIPRGNLYDGKDDFDRIADRYYEGETIDPITGQAKMHPIMLLETKYRDILEKAKFLDLTDSNVAYEWLQELITYYNTHALNLSLGINAEEPDPVRNLLNIFKANGYSAELIDPANITDYNKYAINVKLRELKEYGFFVSDYKEDRFDGLDSDKTLALAKVKKLSEDVEKLEKSVNVIETRMATIKEANRQVIESLDKQIADINKEYDPLFNQLPKVEELATDSTKQQVLELYKKYLEAPSMEKGIEMLEIVQGISDVNPEDEFAATMNTILTTGSGDENREITDPEKAALRDQLRTAVKDEEAKYAEFVEGSNRKIKEVTDIIAFKKGIVTELREQYEITDLDYAALATKENAAKSHALFKKVLDAKDRLEKATPDTTQAEANMDKTFEEVMEEEAKANDFDFSVKQGLLGKVKDKLAANSEDTKEAVEESNDVEFIKLNDEEEKEPVVEEATEEDDFDFSIKKKGLFNKKEKAPVKETVEDAKGELEETDDFDFSIKKKSLFSKKEKVEEAPAEEVIEVTDDDFDFSLDNKDDSLNSFVAIRSFKKINRELYEKTNSSKAKSFLSKAVEKLKEHKKAVCVCVAMAGIIAIGVVAGMHAKNNNSEPPVKDNDKIETMQEDNGPSMTDIEEAVDQLYDKEEVEVSLPETKDSQRVVEMKTLEQTDDKTLEEATKDSINDVLEGNKELYASSQDAMSETNGIDSSKLYRESWNNATGGAYYAQTENGGIEKLSEEEALERFAQGQNLVQGVENDGTVIGYVNVDNVQGQSR